MRKVARLSRLILAGALFLSPSLSLSQAGVAAPRDNPGQFFASIHDSLMEAANSAIETTDSQQPVTTSSDHAQEAPPMPMTISLESDSQMSRGRVSALNQVVLPILAREGVPNQLAAVIQVESGGNPLALSPKGARGIWQLMPDTARRYGLRVDDQSDERIDPEKSTTTAARYLRDLYAQFGSWPLALAAYNSGELNLQRAIVRARSTDFATLGSLGYLPAETRNYVPAVLAAMGKQVPAFLVRSEEAQPVRFVYATSEQAGQ